MGTLDKTLGTFDNHCVLWSLGYFDKILGTFDKTLETFDKTLGTFDKAI